jgi:hypothetical protein
VTDTPIPQHTLDAAARALRFQFLSELNMAFANSGLTPDHLAARLGWPRHRVLRTLRGRGAGKLTLREMAEMAYAIDGSIIEFSMESKSE